MLRKTYMSWRFCLVMGLVVLLGGCQSGFFVSPQSFVGKTADQVVAARGVPSARISMPDGTERLQYSGQPWGRYVWNFDLDASGQVRRVYQALQESCFVQIPHDGSWGAQEVLREFGVPASVDHVMSWKGDIWKYRWSSANTDMFYYIYFDQNGRVRRSEAGMDYTRERFDWSR